MESRSLQLLRRCSTGGLPSCTPWETKESVGLEAEFLSSYAARGGGRGLGPEPELSAALLALMTAACPPGADELVADGDFIGHVAERLPVVDDPLPGLQALHASDLYLACACARGVDRALAIFETRVLAQLAKYLLARGFEDALVEEVKQLVRSRFLMADASGRKRITEYNGRAALVAWLRTAAFRLAVNLRAAETGRREVSADNLLPELAAAPDPELALLKSHFAHEFRAAFQRTLADLEPRESNILRLHFLDGMTLVSIAALYRVTERTIRRWIIDIKSRIVAETERQLREQGQLTATGLDGVIGVLRSHLDVTLTRFFSGDGDSDPKP